MAMPLSDLLRGHPVFPRLAAAVREGKSAEASGLWGSSLGLLLAALAAEGKGPFLAITAGREEADALAGDLALFGCEGAEVLPEPEPEPLASPGWMRLLGRLLEGPAPRVLCAPLASLTQALPAPGILRARTLVLAPGDERPPQEIAGVLDAAGLNRVAVVAAPGEYALRGCVLDLFPPGAARPVRLDYDGDAVETVAEFDADTQRSARRLDRAALLLGGRRQDPAPAAEIAAYLPPGAAVVRIEPEAIEARAAALEGTGEASPGRLPLGRALGALPCAPALAIRSLPGEGAAAPDFGIRSLVRFEGSLVQVASALKALAERVPRVFLFSHNEGEEARIREVLGDALPAPVLQRFEFRRGHLSRGFETAEPPLAVLGHQELFHRYAHRRPVPAEPPAPAADPFSTFREGDAVVHADHGIGIFRGAVRIPSGDGSEEHLAIEYDGGTRVLVPPERAHLVERYVGPGEGSPPLHAVGGTLWGKTRSRVAEATAGLAREMLATQAARRSSEGVAHPDDDPLQREFEAAFLYPDTPDQQTASAAIRRDLVAPRPMDRLLCGDVGFGKTELAIRAAFRSARGSRQTAVLVPTTILAEQHRQTFAERLADFPVRVASLSRFLAPAEERRTLEGLAAGEIDVVIGTHRLLQPDVRFKDLGLVIIDEEQRFGVAHKERLKAFRQTVDVLTMTATPIPRTLHMALLGLRDIANLKTAPPGRQPIETRVCRFDPALVREAILRELERDGQCFFVHNRVRSLEARAGEISRIAPEARIATAHGQMPARLLEARMLEFLDRRIDVLCCTTIIESGIDLPNANTIFIDQADRYGLADLHQLRGRVGRYLRKAHAFLLLSPGTHPASQAALRLKALEEFSDLGSGFQIALRDLEIRGAGNLLGAEQHGHIASVGYGMYVRLLEEAVARSRGEAPPEVSDAVADLPVAAEIPAAYVPGLPLRISLYRRLADARGDRLDKIAREIADRFGRPPAPLGRLVRLLRLRERLGALGIARLARGDEILRLSFADEARVRETSREMARGLRILEPGEGAVPLPDRVRDGEALLAFAERLLGTGRGNARPAPRRHALKAAGAPP